MGHQPREEESLAERVQRLDRVREKERELQRLETKLRKEKQFNRKVEINAEIRTLSTELAQMAGEEEG